jgi:hypothetical protein
MFKMIPEFNTRLGEASMNRGISGYKKIFLTSPKTEASILITETPEQEVLKQKLI